jgi:hydrogenase maturation protease
MSDDGAGVKVIQLLAENYRFPPDVTVLDGGTLGLDLLPRLEGIDRLLIVDAVETGNAPGSLIRLSGEEIPIIMETKLSPHQMGLKDLIAVSILQGVKPPEMVLLGVQPECIELGLDLSPSVEAQLDELVQRVLQELGTWGIRVEPVDRITAARLNWPDREGILIISPEVIVP